MRRWSGCSSVATTMSKNVCRKLLQSPDPPRRPPLSPPSVPVTPTESIPSTPHQQARQAKRKRRVERNEWVRELHRQGKSVRGIARELRMSVRTILRYLHESHCPDWQLGRERKSRLDSFRYHVDRRIQEGCRNAAGVRSEKDTNWLSCFPWTDRIIPNPVLNGCDEQQRASSGRRPVSSNTDISAARTSAAPPLADCRKVQSAW